jgi:hypothetical protein
MGIVAAGDSGWPSEESAEGKGDPKGRTVFLRAEGLSGGSKQCGTVLWLAERGGLNVDGLARKNACYLPGLRLPRLLPRE